MTLARGARIFFALLSLACLLALVWPVTLTTVVTSISPEIGHAYVSYPRAPTPPVAWFYQVPDALFGGLVQVFENGVALDESAPLDTRDKGAGRHSSSGGPIFFSSTDNSDPRTNGRTYSAVHELVPRTWLTIVSFFSFAMFLWLPPALRRASPEVRADPTIEPSSPATWFDWLALAMIGIAGLRLFAHTLYRCNFGLGFQDESIFLEWIARPWADKYMFSLNGVLFHPLYRLVHGDIVSLRQLNMSITLLLTAALIGTVFWRFGRPGRVSRADLGACVVLMLACATGLVSVFVRSPSYYHLSYQSTLLAAFGLLLADRGNSKASLVGWVAVGAALYLSFMARMPSVFVLAAVAAAYLLLTRKFEVRKAILAAAVSLMCLCATILVLDGGFLPFVQRIADIRESFASLGNVNALNILRIDDFYLNIPQRQFIAATAIATLAATLLVASAEARRHALGAISCMAVCALLLAILGQKYVPDMSFIYYFAAPMTWGILLGALAVPPLCRRDAGAGAVSGISWELCCTVAMLSLLPLVSVFGTGQHQWALMQPETSFWVLAALVAVAPVSRSLAVRPWRVFVPAAALAQVVVFTASAMDRNVPWPTRDNSVEVTFPSTGVDIFLDAANAAYLNEIGEMARGGGFAPGTPFINLTGNYRVVQFFLGARSLGSITLAEHNESTEKSVARTQSLLDKEPLSDVRRAWILVEPEGSMSTSPSVLERYGIDIARYVTVGRVTTPTKLAYGGRAQYLLKPPPGDSASADARRGTPPPMP